LVYHNDILRKGSVFGVRNENGVFEDNKTTDALQNKLKIENFAHNYKQMEGW
jgi:hypothetical protein